jgi:tryptophan-rich sensory protein
MSIDQSQTESFELSRELSWLKPSHRSWPEQLLGLGIYLVLSFGVDLLHRWLLTFSVESSWYQNLPQAPWAMADWPASTVGTFSLFSLSLSMWSLWRRHSLKKLKLELSLYLSIFILVSLWSFTFFGLRESLLGLVALLLSWCTLPLMAVLFWKKDRLSSGWLSIPFLWIFYLASLTMFICTMGAP